MSVVTTKSDVSFCSPDDRCNICDSKLWPPFLKWRAHTNILICGSCCQNIRPGLTADLIQLSAIVEMNRLGHGYYRDQTLVRKDKKKAEAETLARSDLDSRFRFEPPYISLTDRLKP